MAHQRVAPNRAMSNTIAEFFPAGYKGYAIDVGASDGISVNSTWQLEKDNGWTVLSVEPNPDFFAMLSRERLLVARYACSNHNSTAILRINEEVPEAYSAIKPPDRAEAKNFTKWKDVEVRVTTVDVLLEKWQFPKLDVLCVDTEGTELDVLEGCDILKWKPKVIITECWEPEGPIDPYLSERGYRKHERTRLRAYNDLWTLEV